MLIIEIAIGVFVGGIGLWLFVQSREKHSRAVQANEQFQKARRAAEHFVAERYQSISANYLDIFRGRLATIFDDPNESPITIAGIEWKLAGDNLEKTKVDVAAEAHEAIKAYDTDGQFETINEHIKNVVSREASQASDALILLYLGELKSLNDDDLPSVTKGHPRKQFNLGNAHRLGQDVEQDYQKAERLLRASAEQGYADAQFVLGSMYESGEGVTKNYSEALKYYSFAAEQGYAPAMTNIGVIYFDGAGVEKDYAKATTWFMLAAAKGENTAIDNLKVACNSLTPEQMTGAEHQAILKDRGVLELLLRISHDYIENPLPLYYNAIELAKNFSETYLASFQKSHIWMVLPQSEELERWSVSDAELTRCKEQGILVAAMGIIVTISKNKDSDFSSDFSQRLADRVVSLLSWQDRDAAATEVLNIIENYKESLETERVFSFAADFTERVFGGNPNESKIFAENFWDRAFAVHIAMMSASKEFITWCIAIEMKDGILKDMNVAEFTPTDFLRLVRTTNATHIDEN